MADSSPSSPRPPSVDEFRVGECNGHSSPDSGVNDMSESMGRANTNEGMTAAEARVRSNHKVHHKITLLADETVRIQLPDNTVRHVTGKAMIGVIYEYAH